MTTSPRRAALVQLAAAAVAAWLVVDVARGAQVGAVDAERIFSVASMGVALGAAAAIGRWPESRRSAWLILAWVAAGAAADAGGDWPDSRLAATVMLAAFALQAPLYAHMALTYPAGRVGDRLERAFLAAAYGVSALWQLTPALFGDPRGCTDCAPRVPSLLFAGHWSLFTPLGDVYSALFIALGVAFVALVVRRVRRSPPGARRTLAPLTAAACFAAAEFVVLRIAWLSHWTAPLTALAWIDDANMLVVPAAVGAGLATIRRHRGPLGDLVVRLRAARPEEIERALADAVGDPSLALALRLPGGFVDPGGHPVDVDVPGRAVTFVGPAEDPVAALLHDPALTGQRPLLEAAGSAALLALENARLQAELRAQLLELRASQARIVAAADTERRRLERDLHDGAQQRLLSVGLALQLADGGDPRLAAAQAELQAALRELRELARGIHPSILTDNGLAAAVGSLADRAPLPVAVDVAAGRHAEAVESAAYFVVCEALANVAKHARARSAAVAVRRVNGRLVVEVRDDGRGGADAAGSGLRGLADRVGALDGRLTVSSAPDAGTTVRAEIPCASS